MWSKLKRFTVRWEHLIHIKQNDIIGLTLYLVHFAILEGCYFAPMWKTRTWQHLTKRDGLLVIHLAYLVPSQKSERSCICLLRVSIYLSLRFWERLVLNSTTIWLRARRSLREFMQNDPQDVITSTLYIWLNGRQLIMAGGTTGIYE
jgi:hypothetical protein